MAIVLAYFLDIFLGDFAILRWPLHGIEVIAKKLIKFFRKFKNFYIISILVLLSLCFIIFTASLSFILILRKINNTMEFAGEIYLIFLAFSISLPEKGVNEVYDRIYENDLELAKEKLSVISEETKDIYNENDMIKTAVTATAQNCLHDFFTPVVFAFFGGGITAILCRSIYIVHHTILKDKYFSEKTKLFPYLIMEFINFIPSRLLIILLPVAGGFNKMKKVFVSILKYGHKYNYLNDGIPISAFSAYTDIPSDNSNQSFDESKLIKLDDINLAVNYMYRLSYITIFLILLINLIKK